MLRLLFLLEAWSIPAQHENLLRLSVAVDIETVIEHAIPELAAWWLSGPKPSRAVSFMFLLSVPTMVSLSMLLYDKCFQVETRHERRTCEQNTTNNMYGRCFLGISQQSPQVEEAVWTELYPVQSNDKVFMSHILMHS